MMTAKIFKHPNPGRSRFRSRSGFTLIELLIAIAIAGIVISSLVGAYAALNRSYTTQNVAAEVQEAMRSAIDFMAEDIMMAGFDPDLTADARIVAATATTLHFTSDRNMNGAIDASDFEEIHYFLSASQLFQQLYSDNTTDEIVVDNINNMSFRYFDGAEPPNELIPPLSAANLNAIRSIELSMTVTQPAGRGGNVNRTYTTRVRCRNIGL
jgi:prepilin-type N-terminal cleavage/methylation domain-containing protein